MDCVAVAVWADAAVGVVVVLMEYGRFCWRKRVQRERERIRRTGRGEKTG